MEKQILLNLLIKHNLYEIGNSVHIYTEMRDLNNRIIPEDYIEEFKKLIIIEENYYTVGESL
jgi:hypothetical protein